MNACLMGVWGCAELFTWTISFNELYQADGIIPN